MKADAETIKLQFAAYLKGSAMKSLAHTLVEFSHLLTVIGIGQTEHRALVKYRLKLIVEIRPHAPGRTVRVVQLRIHLLQVLQTMHLHVKLLIGDDWRIEHIVIIIMSVKFLSQTENFFLVVGSCHVTN